MKKYYVLDTNILLQSPGAIYGFEDNTVVITGTTLQELDSKKNPDGEIGYNARQTARILEDIRNRGNLIKGVKLKETDGKLIFEPNEVSQENSTLRSRITELSAHVLGLQERQREQLSLLLMTL